MLFYQGVRSTKGKADAANEAWYERSDLEERALESGEWPPPGHRGRDYVRAIVAATIYEGGTQAQVIAHHAHEGGWTYKRIARELGVSMGRAAELARVRRDRLSRPCGVNWRAPWLGGRRG